MSNALETIPLCQLKPSKSNMRKTDKLADIDQLAASIEANGLLENLVVHRAKGESFEVVAGGRRLAALKVLAKSGKLGFDHPVACLVLDEAVTLTEISLAENFERVPPHPADQFEAFARLIKDNKTAVEVAARFGVSETFVLQRLKLAQVSPRLIAEYRKVAMTLEQLTAFTICDDHKKQEQLWFESPYEDMPGHFIRRQLTASQVDASDRRAVFVGKKAYEAAGGVIVRDLFDAEHEGFWQDSQLLDRLVAEKLGSVAENVRADGWGWVEVAPYEDFPRLSQFGRIGPTEVTLPPEEEERLSKLAERYDELVSLMEEEGDDAHNHELDRVDREIKTLDAKKEVWLEEDKARSGVIVSLDRDGDISLTTGLVRREPSEANENTTGPAPTPKPRRSGYSEAVLADLSAHRTAALRATLVDQPDNAMIALLHAFVCRIFFGRRLSYMEIGISEADLTRASQTVAESNAGRLMSERHVEWATRLSAAENIQAWLVLLEDTDRQSLLAYCVAASINALRGNATNGLYYDDDQDLAQLAGLDMTCWWKPTEAFLVRLSKADIIEAVTEGAAPGSARYLVDLKRSELARRAEGLLAESRWLPKPWRAEKELVQAAE